jgi:hypothetical protein
MSERHNYGVRCICGELFVVGGLEQEEDVPIETLRDRLRRTNWVQILHHGHLPGQCTKGKTYFPDDVVRMP